MNQFAGDPRMVQVLIGLLLTYCRVQACFMMLPVFSERALPVRVRTALAMAVTPLLAEQTPPAGEIDGLLQLAGLAGAEIVSGLALGGLVRLFASALDVAATAIAATSSLSQLIGAANEYSPHPIGNLMHLAGLAVLMALGFPALACDLLRESLVLRPLGDWPQVADLLSHAVGLIRQSFVLAMLLASPFILGGFLFQLLSGMISKVMPNLPIVFIAAPGAILLALLALAVLTPSIVSVWAGAVLDVAGELLR
ncbi:flagellar biosynthetic protein FliR [Paracoccus aminovorans]|uniref:flagellar biosynthetic protein FliR n=1 Tax=Paracoccus aminovorans TaxID=34004 RepID=UPI002B25A7B5|nr:flagellar biosynthetic protein FliR [Paracoccus aminovorans]